LHKPLRVEHFDFPNGTHGWATNGTPSDCVVLGIADILPEKPDLVISGINAGPNLGEDLTYSGTVSAAMEGVIFGVASFAISISEHNMLYFDSAARFAVRLSKAIMENTLPQDTFLNVNVPSLPEEEIVGVEITKQARRRYKGRLDKRIDPRGREYYWLGGELLHAGILTGTDVDAIDNKKISVTPIHLDLTQHDFMKELKSWRLQP